MADRLTLETIAELSGVSRSTVSRVINDQASVSPNVRERVLQIIAETGYQPNMAARSLVSHRSNIIGVVIPRIVQSVFEDPYFPRLIQGISQICNNRDYILSLFLFHSEDEEKKLYPRVVRQGIVDGVIISSTQMGDQLVPQMVESKMPFLVIGRPTGASNVSFVDVDNRAGAFTAVAHLISLDYQNIATITLPQDVRAGIDRLKGYRDAMDARGRQIDENLIVSGNFTEAGGYAAMQRLIQRNPDAVFAASDAMAFGAMRAIREAGLRIPEDIAIVGFDDLPTAATAVPPLTTIRQPIRRIGKLAVETLIDMLTNGVEPARRIVLPTDLVIRDSCGANLR